VRHRRLDERAYKFQYGVYYLYVDLDEIEEVDRRIKPLSYNRFNVMSLLDRDHMGYSGEGVRAAVHRRLIENGIDPGEVSVGLLTNARILNYVFNPVSFYLVHDRDNGALMHVLAEVHNTHGERHVYDLRHAPGDTGSYTSRADKVFYVSPFIDMDARYEFACAEREGTLDLRIDEFRGDEMFFQAQLQLAPMPLTNGNVVRMLARYPLVTLKTIGLIHWQGLKLWLRGERYRPNPRKQAAKR
jgi:DUF1365 family protein